MKKIYRNKKECPQGLAASKDEGKWKGEIEENESALNGALFPCVPQMTIAQPQLSLPPTGSREPVEPAVNNYAFDREIGSSSPYLMPYIPYCP